MDLREIALNKSKKRHPWELARVKVIKQFVKQILDSRKSSFTILDIGSGDIYMINELAKEFVNASFFAVDIEYDQEYINTTNKESESQKKKIRVFNDLVLAEKVIDQPVDLVLLLDVIEHVPDDVALLKGLTSSKWITKQTAFLITVPAYKSLFGSHDVFLGHYRRYNNRLLKQNVLKSNLIVIDAGYFFFFLLIPRFFQVIWQKTFRPNEKVTGIGNWNGQPGFSGLFTKMLWADFMVSKSLRKIGIKLPGLSNYAICKKSA